VIWGIRPASCAARRGRFRLVRPRWWPRRRPPASESTRLLAQPLAAEPRSVTPPSTSSSQRVIIQPKPNRRVAIMVTLAVAMGTGLVLGLVIGGSSPDALPTRPVPVSVPVVTPEVAERAPEPAIAAHPEASTPEPSVSPGEDSNPRRPDRPERIDRRPRVPRPASDDPPPPERALGVDPKEVIQLSQKLQQEALAKKSAAAPESALAMGLRQVFGEGGDGPSGPRSGAGSLSASGLGERAQDPRVKVIGRPYIRCSER
jgi:hypothetical protein